ncbi:MAG: hypothetical protein ACD_23C00866G0001 [uncultured bacterium]|nr:MAG: hypothetical protein ACD_23C00866G0001 [uncultured bacterium]
MAQSSVTLYGVADAGVTYLNGADNWSGVTSGNNLTSRLGFRGVEDLGGGLKANFVIEGGFNLDNGDGASGYAGAKAGDGFQFKRRSTIGLAGGFGEVRMGRELTAAYNATARYDVFGSVGLGQSRLWADGGVVDASGTPAANQNVGNRVTTNQRISNALTYVSPDFSGFKVGVNYGFGETTNGNSDSGYMGAGLMYDNGPLSLGLGLERLNSGLNSDPVSDIDAWSLGGSYNFGVAKLLAGYRESTVDRAAVENKRNGYYVAATAPVGAGTVRVSYNRYENELANVKTKADQFAIGYVYGLSKRTSVYGTYAYLKQKDFTGTGAMYTLGSGGLKTNGSQQGVQVGVSHAF